MCNNILKTFCGAQQALLWLNTLLFLYWIVAACFSTLFDCHIVQQRLSIDMCNLIQKTISLQIV